MARMARGEYLDPHTVQIVHTVQRCVRRAWLCGSDPLTEKSYEHRRAWIRDRLEFLASVFGIDCLTYAILNNHMHMVLRSRPDIVRQWTDQEVARRWLRLFPRRRMANGNPAKPDDAELNTILLDPQRLAEVRKRLSDISWWMRCAAENVARMANREDGCTGRFWEGRFRAQLILDEAALLACAMYVDLNPVRAAMASTPETSEFTGARERIDDLRRTRKKRKHRNAVRSGWMSPLEIHEKREGAGADCSSCRRRASRKGFLSISLTRYLELLDWTGRQLRSDKRGSIPSSLAPILQRLGIESQGWCDLVGRFGRLFKRASGRPNAIQVEAERRGQRYMHAPGSSLFQKALSA